MTGLPPPQSAGTSGFALVIVLWSVSFLAILGTAITTLGRSESQLAANMRANAAAEAQADGLVYEAIFRLLDRSERYWAADGQRHALTLRQGIGEVQIADLGGRIGLNVAPVTLLQALLHQLGVEPHRAATLAASIVDWRSSSEEPMQLGTKALQYHAAGLHYGPPNAPFRSDEELAYVLGMTPEILARLKPHVSSFQERSPIIGVATPAVLAALIDAGGSQVPFTPAEDVNRLVLAEFTAAVTRSDGAGFTRRAVVRIGPGAPASGGRPYLILAWDAGAQ